MPTDIAKRLEPIVADAVTGVGFDLDALEVQQAGRRKLVKVIVDSDAGVGLDEVADVSRAVSAVLDEHDELLAGAYTLEVTSPGLGRPLTQQRHWRRAKFRLVKITPKEGAAYTGRVGLAGEQSVRVLVDGRITEVKYASLAKASVEVEFKQPPVAELKRLESDEVEVTEATAAAKRAGSGHTGRRKKEEPR